MFLLIRTHLGWLSIYWSSPYIVCLFFPGLLTSAPENPGCTGFCHFFPSLGGAFQLSRDILKLSVSFEHCCKIYYFKIRNHAIRAFKHCKSREEYVPKINAPIIVGHLPSLHQPSLYMYFVTFRKQEDYLEDIASRDPWPGRYFALLRQNLHRPIWKSFSYQTPPFFLVGKLSSNLSTTAQACLVRMVGFFRVESTEADERGSLMMLVTSRSCGRGRSWLASCRQVRALRVDVVGLEARLRRLDLLARLWRSSQGDRWWSNLVEDGMRTMLKIIWKVQ